MDSNNGSNDPTNCLTSTDNKRKKETTKDGKKVKYVDVLSSGSSVSADRPDDGSIDQLRMLRKNAAVFNYLESLWNGWGTPEASVWTPVTSNRQIGLPPWPTDRQSRRIVRNGNYRMVVTEGLVESFQPNHPLLSSLSSEQVARAMAGHGLGCEVFAISQVEDGEPVPGHWLFDIVGRVADEIALRGPEMGGLLKIGHQNDGIISMDIDAHVSMFPADLQKIVDTTFVHTSPCAPPNVDLGTRYMTVLIMANHNSPQGMPMKVTVPSTNLPVNLYCIQILTNAESKLIYQMGRVGRLQVYNKLKSKNLLGINSLRRISVIENSKTTKG